MPVYRLVWKYSKLSRYRINTLVPPLFIAPNLPTLDGNWIIYNGTIVTIHNNACPLFTDFRYDSEWRICIGILRNTAFLGKLSNDARVITWNNGNTWIRQESRTPNEDLATHMAPPETGVVKYSCPIEQQQSAATQTTRNTSTATDPPTSQQLAHSKPQQQPQDVHEGI